jgi:hypothetical protein
MQLSIEQVRQTVRADRSPLDPHRVGRGGDRHRHRRGGSRAPPIWHLLRADFLERVRRYSFLVTLAATVWLGWLVGTGKLEQALRDAVPRPLVHRPDEPGPGHGLHRSHRQGAGGRHALGLSQGDSIADGAAVAGRRRAVGRVRHCRFGGWSSTFRVPHLTRGARQTRPAVRGLTRRASPPTQVERLAPWGRRLGSRVKPLAPWVKPLPQVKPLASWGRPLDLLGRPLAPRGRLLAPWGEPLAPWVECGADASRDDSIAVGSIGGGAKEAVGRIDYLP